MTTPHEYMDEYGEWNLHSFHNSDLYNDPDYIANDADYQLPLLSTLGRGPRGVGVKVVEAKNDELNDYRLSFVNDETGEAFLTTPNLDPGYVEVTWPEHNKQEGEVGWMTVSWHRGGDVKSYNVALPPGAHGSRLYLSDHTYAEREDKTYTTSVSDLIHYGLKAEWRDKPMPRPGDIVAFAYSNLKEKSLGFGTIESVADTEVVFTSRTKIGVPIPEISENETWVIDGVDTGLPTRGQKANVELGNVETLPSMSKASVSTSYDEETNTTTINFGIPEGPVGKTVEVQGGVWTVETLPDFETTPVNDAFVVRDGDKQFDLYVRGQQSSIYDEYKPWTVVEDWQGRPGAGMHVLLDPYRLGEESGSVLRVPAAEASLAFSPTDYLTDGAIVIDSIGTLGILGSSEDNSNDYTVTTASSLSLPQPDVSWNDVLDKPFTEVGEGLSVNAGVLSADIDHKWADITDKPISIAAVNCGIRKSENGYIETRMSLANGFPKNDWIMVYLLDADGNRISHDSSISNGAAIRKIITNVWDQQYSFPSTITPEEAADKCVAAEWVYQDCTSSPYVKPEYRIALEYLDKYAEGGGITEVPTWEEIPQKPFDMIGENLFVEDGMLNAKNTKEWRDIDDKPFDAIGNGLSVSINPETAEAELNVVGGTGEPYEFTYLDHNVYERIPTRSSSYTTYEFSIPKESKWIYVKIVDNNLSSLAVFSKKMSEIIDSVTTVNDAISVELDSSPTNRIDVFINVYVDNAAYIDVRSFSAESSSLNNINAANVFTIYPKDQELPEVATVEETKQYLGIQ